MLKVFNKYKNYIDLAYVYDVSCVNIENIKNFAAPVTHIDNVINDEIKFGKLFKKCEISSHEHTREIKYVKESIISSNTIACLCNHICLVNNMDFHEIEKLSYIHRRYTEVSHTNNRILNIMLLNEIHNIL